MNSCRVLNAISSLWALFVYICAADLVMILRVWAMYNRSNIVLGILLTSYLWEIVASAAQSILDSNPRRLAAIVEKTSDLSSCLMVEESDIWNNLALLSQLAHAGVMCTLVIIRFTILSVRMYRATKQWRLGPILNLLVMEGMAYFFAVLMWNLLGTIFDFGYSLGPMQVVFVDFVQYIPIATLTPRFILNIREVHSRSIYGGRGYGIDTGFGLTVLSSHGASRSSIAFAPDGGEREGFPVDDTEDIVMQRRVA